MEKVISNIPIIDWPKFLSWHNFMTDTLHDKLAIGLNAA